MWLTEFQSKRYLEVYFKALNVIACNNSSLFFLCLIEVNGRDKGGLVVFSLLVVGQLLSSQDHD